jgi:prepilin-type N-terminal cleavage/methylation domain-containing protein
MKHRSGVTLVEVLVTIFIMAIGMLALLTLFPVGAISMGRALIYDRAAQAANNAEAIAIANDIRHDPFVKSDTAFPADAFTTPFGTALPATGGGPSFGVFVDPWGFLIDTTAETFGANTGPPTTPGMRRRSISLSNSTAHGLAALTATECGRWCSLTDDLYWTPANIGTDGTADTSTGAPKRGLAYTWSWHLRRPQAYNPTVVDMSIIIYRGRSAATSLGETTYPVAAASRPAAAGTTSVTIDWTGLTAPAVRTGRWIADVSTAANGAVPGYFYRVVDYADLGGNQMQLELETPLKQDTSVVVIMEDVVEVIDKGSGWLP